MGTLSSKGLKLLQFVGLSSALLMLVSCIFPTRLGEPHPFSNKRLEFIEYGVTNKEDVQREIGKPALQLDDWWLFSTERRKTEWVFFIAGPGGAGGDSFGGGYSDHRLLVGFDSEGLVQRFGVFDQQEACDRARNICFSPRMPYLVSVLETSDADRSAKSFAPTQGLCGFYFFTRTSVRKEGIMMYLDGHTIGTLTFDGAYIYRELGAGDHLFYTTEQLVGMHDGIETSLDEIEFACAPGESLFVEWKESLAVTGKEQGERAVLERRIATPLLH